MQKLFIAVVLLFATSPAWPQQGNTRTIAFHGVPTGTCAFNQLANDITNGNMYFCDDTFHWKQIGTGSGTPSAVPVLISTSGPVADPGGAQYYQFNNAAGALTFTAPAGVAGYQRCYRNATGKSGVITIQMATSNTVDSNGVNGSSAGTLVSGGALGDAACIVSDAANHWYLYVQSGIWANN